MLLLLQFALFQVQVGEISSLSQSEICNAPIGHAFHLAFSLSLSASLPPSSLCLLASPPRRSFACFGLSHIHTDTHTHASRKPAAYVSHVKRQRTSFTLRAALITTQLSTATATATATSRFVPRRVFLVASLCPSLAGVNFRLLFEVVTYFEKLMFDFGFITPAFSIKKEQIPQMGAETKINSKQVERA